MCGNPFKKIGKFTRELFHNPAATLLPQNFIDSGFYRSVVRPVTKAATGAALGFVGSGGNPLGAILGGVQGGFGGGLNSPFQPLKNIGGPLVTGGLTSAVGGLASGLGAGTGSSTLSSLGNILAPGTTGPLSGVANTLADFGTSAGLNIGDFLTTGNVGNLFNGATDSLFGGAGSAEGGSGGGGLMSKVLGGLFGTPGINPQGATGPGGQPLQGNILTDLGMLLIGTAPGSSEPGTLTPEQRAMVNQMVVEATKGGFEQDLAALTKDPRIQEQLAQIEKDVTDQTRAEMLDTYGRTLSQTGGFGGSQQAQLQNQIASVLGQRLASARMNFLLSAAQARRNARLSGMQIAGNIPRRSSQPSTQARLGALLAMLGGGGGGPIFGTLGKALTGLF